MKTRIGLVTCRVLPEPDPEAELLAGAVVAAGAECRWVAWDDPAVRWDEFDACVLRSAWNYHRSVAEFLAWLDRVSAQVPVWNPPRVVRWNLHKRYLLELAAAGHPVVPTVLLPRGTNVRLEQVAEARRWTDVVIKPAVSAASRDTLRVRGAERGHGEAHLARLLALEDVLIQEYQEHVEGVGERALVWIRGEFTHAVRKSPRFGNADESVRGPLPIDPEERAVAQRVITAAWERLGAPDLLYARIDLVRTDDGMPRVMECELIEPSLFTHLSPAALGRLATSIAALGART